MTTPEDGAGPASADGVSGTERDGEPSGEPVVGDRFRTPLLDAHGVLVPVERDAADLCSTRQAAELLGVTEEAVRKLRQRGRLRGWPSRRSTPGGRLVDYRFVIEEVLTHRRGDGGRRSTTTSSAGWSDAEFLRAENAQLQVALVEAQARAELLGLERENATLRSELDAARTEIGALRAALAALVAPRS